MTGGLFDPLGTDRSDAASRPPVAVIVAGLALAALTVLFAVSWLRDDGARGYPVAVVPIVPVAAPPRPPSPPVAPPPPVVGTTASPPAAVAVAPPDQDVEVQNGVRIIRPRRSAPGAGSQTLPVSPPPP